MITAEKVIVLDIDGTICNDKKKDQSYMDIKPRKEVLDKLMEYKSKSYYIILYTSRNMRSFEGNIGKINANTAKVLFDWLEKYNVQYDEIHFGKPWCGKNGFYVDDKAIRPSEFLKYNYEEIIAILEKESEIYENNNNNGGRRL